MQLLEAKRQCKAEALAEAAGVAYEERRTARLPCADQVHKGPSFVLYFRQALIISLPPSLKLDMLIILDSYLYECLLMPHKFFCCSLVAIVSWLSYLLQKPMKCIDC